MQAVKVIIKRRFKANELQLEHWPEEPAEINTCILGTYPSKK